jgi:hypothetical protein
VVDAAALPAPRAEAVPEGEVVAEDSREVITAPDLGARLTTGRGRRAIAPRGRWAFAMVLGTLLVTELLGALVYRGLVAGGPPPAATGATAGLTAAPVDRCPAPGPVTAPVPVPAPSQPPPSTRAGRTAGEARPSKLRGARERKRSSQRPRSSGSWAIGRKNVTRTVARRAPSARATELHVDPFAE